MRFAPVSLALSLVLAISASGGHTASVEAMDPRALALEAEGRSALAVGDTNRAIDNFEAALAIQPGSARITLGLAEAARMDGMQGKALHYYRRVLTADPQNLDAIAGEGEALAEKGALDKARASLVRLEGLCGKSCAASEKLSSAISRGGTAKLSAMDIEPKALPSSN